MSKTMLLTPFERCLLWDDRPAYPCMCFMRFRFAGGLVRAAFEAAVKSALLRHPLLNSIVKIGWQPYWFTLSTPQLNIAWQRGACGGPLPHATRLDIRQSTGLRVIVVQDETNTDLTLQWHHACCDGAGIFRFIEDVLVAYDGTHRASGTSVEPTPVDASLLLSRGSYGLSLAGAAKLLPKQLMGVIGASKFWVRRPAPIVAGDAGADKNALSTRFPASVGCHPTREETIAIRKAARSRNVTLNAFLARDFFHSLWDWQKQHGEYRGRNWLRMMIPINMRDTSYRSLPAMNYMSSVFLDRRGCEAENDAQLLHSIHGEMQIIKNHDLRYAFLFILWLMQWIPGALKRSVNQDTCKTSAIFSNLGKVFGRCKLPRTGGRLQVGDLELIEIDGLPPVRPYNGLTMFSHEYENRLKFNLHYDPSLLSDADAREIMQLFNQRIRSRFA